MPIEQPTFELRANLKTAKALGMTEGARLRHVRVVRDDADTDIQWVISAYVLSTQQLLLSRDYADLRGRRTAMLLGLRDFRRMHRVDRRSIIQHP